RFVRRDYERGQMSRDMTLYVDDDRKAYLLTSSEENQTLHLHELTEDYTGFTGKWTRIFPGNENEGPAIFKHKGKYYMISSGCTGWKPNPARSGVADSIWGPWKSIGNPCRGTDQEKKTTFESQSTFILPAPGKPGSFIFMGDRWRPENSSDGRYVWLPIEWEGDKPVLNWHAEWNMSVFSEK
ncbi:MAG: family 43 glycosylhydrolase, partial [Candidatus Methylacidiphilales bacterium]